MGPLQMVNWRRVNHGFCLTRWGVAIVLAAVVLVRATPSRSATHAVHGSGSAHVAAAR